MAICATCDYKARDNHEMRRHIQSSKHLTNCADSNICHNCLKSFDRKNAYTIHVRHCKIKCFESTRAPRIKERESFVVSIDSLLSDYPNLDTFHKIVLKSMNKQICDIRTINLYMLGYVDTLIYSYNEVRDSFPQMNTTEMVLNRLDLILAATTFLSKDVDSHCITHIPNGFSNSCKIVFKFGKNLHSATLLYKIIDELFPKAQGEIPPDAEDQIKKIYNDNLHSLYDSIYKRSNTWNNAASRNHKLPANIATLL
jgi:hypothetical protein